MDSMKSVEIIISNGNGNGNGGEDLDLMVILGAVIVGALLLWK